MLTHYSGTQIGLPVPAGQRPRRGDQKNDLRKFKRRGVVFDQPPKKVLGLRLLANYLFKA